MFNQGGVEHFARRSGGDPYVRWGETVSIDFLGLASGVQVIRREFQRVTLPRPTLCQLNLAARVRNLLPAPADPQVDFVRIVYTAGLGSSQVETRRVFQRLPQVPTADQPQSVQLNAMWLLPLQDLYAAIEAQAFDCSLAFTLTLSPVALEQL